MSMPDWQKRYLDRPKHSPYDKEFHVGKNLLFSVMCVQLSTWTSTVSGSDWDPAKSKKAVYRLENRINSSYTLFDYSKKFLIRRFLVLQKLSQTNFQSMTTLIIGLCHKIRQLKIELVRPIDYYRVVRFWKKCGIFLFFFGFLKHHHFTYSILQTLRFLTSR